MNESCLESHEFDSGEYVIIKTHRKTQVRRCAVCGRLYRMKKHRDHECITLRKEKEDV